MSSSYSSGLMPMEEIIRRVREFAPLLPAGEARKLKAVVTDYQPKTSQITSGNHKIYTVMLQQNTESVRHRLSQLLKTPTFYINFYTEDTLTFERLFQAAYPAGEAEKSREALVNRRIGVDNIFGNESEMEDANHRGVLPDEMVKDFVDSTGRHDLTDETEFEKNTPKKLSELTSVELARLTLWDFIRSHGSDLYFEPTGNSSVIRVMIEDELVLRREHIPAKRAEDLARTFISMADESAQNMRFQSIDSSIKVKAKVGGVIKDFEFRFHCHPVINGTSCVIRSQSNLIKDFQKTGLAAMHVRHLLRAANERQGLVLITGATGSGKTVTLECVYHEHEKPRKKKIIEIVDTVEVVSPHRDQIEVSEFGLSWDDAIRACLRSKPHIIGIGEIRGKHETTKAIEAAMTGHLVLATYHAGDVLKTLDRLMQMDVDIMQLAPSLNIIHSQMLVRRLCGNPECRQIDKTHTQEFGKPVYRAGKGCEQCDFTGYKGITALAESLLFNEEIEELLIHGTKARTILQEMRKQKKFSPFAVSARKKIYDGETSVEEARRMLGNVYDRFYGDEMWLEDPLVLDSYPDEKRVDNEGFELSRDELEEITRHEEKVEKLIKLKILSERGEFGEKEEARKKYEKLKHKWNINDSELLATGNAAAASVKRVHYK